MGKLGENVPLLIDKAVDFMASSQAFREYLKKLPPRNAIPSGIPDESVPLYLQRLLSSALSAEAGRGAVSRRCLLLKGFF